MTGDRVEGFQPDRDPRFAAPCKMGGAEAAKGLGSDPCGWPPGLNEGAAEGLGPDEGELLYCYRQSSEGRRTKILETARDQAELSQAQDTGAEDEGLGAHRVRTA